jgi:transposase
LSTKIHLGCFNENNAIAIVPTGGEVADVTEFDAVFEKLPEKHDIKNGIMDKGYDSNSVRETLALNEMVAVIPPKINRTTEIAFDQHLYKLRNQIERFINRIKQFRRIATRYEKLAETYLVFIYIVATYIMLS